MSIAKMKKIRFVALRDQQEAILKELMLLGCVQIEEPDEIREDPEIAGLVRKESGDLPALRGALSRVNRAISLLERYAGKKKKMFSPVRDIAPEEYLDQGKLRESLDAAENLELLEDSLNRVMAEETRARLTEETLKAWRSVDWPLEKEGTESCAVLMGTFPAGVPFANAQDALREETEAAELLPVGEDKELRYVVLLCLRDERSAAVDALRPVGFSLPNFSGLTGTADENLLRVAREKKDLAEQNASLKEEIVSYADRYDDLRLCVDRLNTYIFRAESLEKMVATESSFAFWGWVEEDSLPKMEAALARFDCSWELEDPSEEDIPKVPIRLRNSKLVDPMNMVTEMYSLPAYDGIDPNPLMFGFFVLFFGFMFADIGYGIILILAGLFLKYKVRSQGTMKYIAGLGILLGISTTFCGVLTGGLFGDAIPVFTENFTAGGRRELWALINPLNEPMTVLLIGIVLGCIHLVFGQCIHIYMGFRDGNALDAILDVVPWWVLFAGIGLIATDGGSWLLWVGIAGLVLTQGRHAKGIVKKFFGGVKSLYDITSWLGDVLSYARLMALMLATSVIASVMNILGSLPGSLIFFIIVFLIGHVFNIGVNIIGTYVHAARLQYLEFFGKFYKEGGVPFKPLNCRAKSVHVAEKQLN